ncbi:MAG: hypothetical protein IT374_09295 [Polyangiaceae bacterium]|nr:hypothetical protein [Polyangiaceae bacterium]
MRRIAAVVGLCLVAVACTTSDGDEGSSSQAASRGGRGGTQQGGAPAAGSAGSSGKPSAGASGNSSAGAAGNNSAGASGSNSAGSSGNDSAGASGNNSTGGAGNSSAGASGNNSTGGAGNSSAGGAGNSSGGNSPGGAAGACSPPTALAWTATEELNMDDPVAAVLGDRLHVFGATAHAVWSAAAPTWKPLAKLPGFVDGVVTHEGRIVLAAGATLLVSDATGEAFTAGLTLPNPRSVRLFSTPLGVARIGRLSKDCKADLLDLAAGVARPLPDVPFKLTCGDGAAAVGATLYVTGDDDLSTTRLVTLDLSAATPSWTPGPSLSPRMAGATLVRVGGALWRVGGTFGALGTDTSAVFELSAARWCEGPALPRALTWPQVALLGGEVVLLGGHSGLSSSHHVGRAPLGPLP